jgi:glycosyltransferase involved in cell wall biosynthesis
MSPAQVADTILGALRDAPPPMDAVTDSDAWAGANPKLSIAIPCHRYDASLLLQRLSACEQAGEVEIILYEDGGGDPWLVKKLQTRVKSLPSPARMIACMTNRGRSAARNAAVAEARADWILLLDADMVPDDVHFLSRYLEAAQIAASPCAVVGGYSLRYAPVEPRFALHRWQALRSEIQPSETRQLQPGLNVYSCNVMVHRRALQECPFDTGFSGWGWEDVDWGLRLEARFPIIHIDNPCSHMGLDEDEVLLAKYSQGATNFARLADRHAHALRASSLLRAARTLRALHFRPLLAPFLKSIVTSGLPVGLRGRALKLWRAMVYADALTPAPVEPHRAQHAQPSR